LSDLWARWRRRFEELLETALVGELTVIGPRGP
jgi:hypothetical protein